MIDRLFEHLPAGATVIDLSTSLPPSTRALEARLAERGRGPARRADDPGSREAAAGTLNIMVGGSQQAYRRWEPLLRDLAENLFYVSPSGSGHTVKLIDNFLGQLTNAATAKVPVPGREDRDRPAGPVRGRVRQRGNSRSFEGRVPPILDRDSAVAFRLALVHAAWARAATRAWFEVRRGAGKPAP